MTTTSTTLLVSEIAVGDALIGLDRRHCEDEKRVIESAKFLEPMLVTRINPNPWGGAGIHVESEDGVVRRVHVLSAEHRAYRV